MHTIKQWRGSASSHHRTAELDEQGTRAGPPSSLSFDEISTNRPPLFAKPFHYEGWGSHLLTIADIVGTDVIGTRLDSPHELWSQAASESHSALRSLGETCSPLLPSNLYFIFMLLSCNSGIDSALCHIQSAVEAPIFKNR